MSRYKRLYRDRRAALATGCVARQATTRCLVHHDTAMEATTRPARLTRARSDSATIRPRGLATQPMLGLQYGTLHATTRRSPRAAWAHRARSRVCWVCTWCTQSSFDSMHCSESLFGTLFMNTVHEQCSQGFKKKNQSNQIK